MKLLYTQSNGVCAIVTPISESGETLEQIIEKAVPAGTPYVQVEDTEIPTDRSYRNAWVVNGDKITVDLAKAKAVHQDKIRVARDPIMKQLDVQYLRAVERGDTAQQTAIARQKQALRDAPADPAIANATTIDELRAYWPDELPR